MRADTASDPLPRNWNFLPRRAAGGDLCALAPGWVMAFVGGGPRSTTPPASCHAHAHAHPPTRRRTWTARRRPRQALALGRSTRPSCGGGTRVPDAVSDSLRCERSFAPRVTRVIGIVLRCRRLRSLGRVTAPGNGAKYYTPPTPTHTYPCALFAESSDFVSVTCWHAYIPAS